MTEAKQRESLDRLEADLSRELYKARWDSGHAAEIVPLLRQCLTSSDRTTLLRALSALAKIGPEAQGATPEVLRMLDHEEARVRETAVWALGNINLRRPGSIVSDLIDAAADEDLLKPALFALIGFGPQAKAAIPLILRVFDSSDSRLRRLSIRGLKEIDADFEEVRTILRRALSDRSKEVRLSAEKWIRSKWPERYKDLAAGRE